jgi:uncharacterized protein (UPF0332 family)
MSPRSEEFIDQARDRLAMAREVLAAGHREGAVSAAYYSMPARRSEQAVEI